MSLFAVHGVNRLQVSLKMVDTKSHAMRQKITGIAQLQNQLGPQNGQGS